MYDILATGITLQPVVDGLGDVVGDLTAFIGAALPVVFPLLAFTIGVPFGVRFVRGLI